MICPHCKSEWNTSKRSDIDFSRCPFCGEALDQSFTETITSLSEGVRLIVKQYDLEHAKNGAVLTGLFKDLTPKLSKEQTMLSYIVKVHGHTDLVSAITKPLSEQREVLRKVARRMTDQMLISDNTAIFICNEFWSGLGGN